MKKAIEENIFNDEGDWVGRIKITYGPKTVDDGEYYECPVVVRILQIEDDMDTDDIKQGLRNEFRREVTSPYDCSAQWFGGIAGGIKLEADFWKFNVYYSLDV